jgi:hypothetical protein
MRRWVLVFVLLFAVGGGCLTLVLWCPKGHVSYCNYERIQVGMALGDVEAILGSPGTEIDEVPTTPEKPVVSGDRFFRWESNHTEIIVGIRDDRVCDKWYWEPSL